MKTTIDKIEAHPPHAFSPGELRAFLRALPGELLRDVGTVRLSSAIKPAASVHVARFSRLERRLVIVSRGVARDRAMREVIRCLVRANCRATRGYVWGPAELSESKIEALTTELFEAVSARMPTPPGWSRVALRYVRKPAPTSGLEPGRGSV